MHTEIDTLHVQKVMKQLKQDTSNPLNEPEPTNLSETIQHAASSLLHKFDAYISDQLGYANSKERLFDQSISYVLCGRPLTRENSELSGSLAWRLEGSAQLAYYYLIQSGTLDHEYQILAQQLGNQLAHISPTEEDEMKAAIVESYLQKVIQRSEEEVAFEDQYSPTIGLETEFPLYKKDNLLKRIHRAFFLDYSSNHKRDKIASTYGIGSGAFRYVKGGSDLSTREFGEVALEPSASYNLQLRDILHLIKSGKLPEDWYVHITVGGIDLEPNKLELMELQSLLIGAGDCISPHEGKTTKDWSQVGALRDRVPKDSVDGKYYPLLKKRNPSKERVRSYKIFQSTVELRGLGRQTSFSGLAKMLKDVFYLGKAVKGFQASNPDEISRQYAFVWAETSKDWQQLLNKYHIRLHSMESIKEDVIDDEVNFGKDQASSDYENALGKISFLSATDPIFKGKVREIVIKARAKVAAIDKSRKSIPAQAN